jgi:hypothetical protein
MTTTPVKPVLVSPTATEKLKLVFRFCGISGAEPARPVSVTVASPVIEPLRMKRELALLAVVQVWVPTSSS